MSARILLVEDDPQIRKVIELLLGMEGIDCRSVENGASALREVRAGTFSGVILDHTLPDMTGLDVWNALPAELSRRVIFMTADPNALQAFCDQSDGRHAALLKPFDVSELLGALGQTLQA